MLEDSSAKKKLKPKPNHYFNNEEVRTLIADYYVAVENSPQQKKLEGQLCEKLFSLCRHLSTAGNFYQYSWKDEFVADAIERCWKAVQNQKFDLTKVDKDDVLLKPFSYFSRIASREFIKIIKREKKTLGELEEYKDHVYREIHNGRGFENVKQVGNTSDEEFFIDSEENTYVDFFDYEE